MSIFAPPGGGFSNFSLHVFSLSCFVLNTLWLFCWLPWAVCPAVASLMLWTSLQHPEAEVQAGNLGFKQPLSSSPLPYFDKKTSVLTGGRSQLRVTLLGAYMFFLAGCQNQNIQGTLTEKNPYICLLCFLLLSHQDLNSVRVENKQIQHQHNQENMLVRPVGWACRLGDPPEVVIF